MKQSLRVLLESLIDYAGLFPPAGLPMGEAVANYDRYRRGPDAWMLGRFVVPLARVGEVPADFPKSVLVTTEELETLPAGIDVVEVKVAHAVDIAKIAGGAGSRMHFVEVADVALIEALAAGKGAKLAAKIRTGGITTDAFPSHTHVATFLRMCAIEGTPFKATAGLHHPLRCAAPLTYEPGAPTGTMHGFINVFMAAALINDAERILMEEDPSAFRFDDESASWRGHAVTTEHLGRVRREFAIAFGSCSFQEPIAELSELGWT